MADLAGTGVIFDMDGVLVDSYAPHLKSWLMLADELGRPITEQEFAATFGQTSREIIRHLFGITDAKTVASYDQRKEGLYRDLIRDRIPEMPGACNLVGTLHLAGAKIAIGSSGPPANVSLVIDGLELAPLLSAVVTGSDVTRGKPDPQVFRLAAERLGMEPAACVVIEDAPVGVEAAHAAGMKCIALANGDSWKVLSNADSRVRELADITPKSVRSLLSNG